MNFFGKVYTFSLHLRRLEENFLFMSCKKWTKVEE
jgi:hypothetical protein